MEGQRLGAGSKDQRCGLVIGDINASVYWVVTDLNGMFNGHSSPSCFFSLSVRSALSILECSIQAFDVLETLSDTGLEAPLPSLFSDAGGGLARRHRHCSSSHVILFNAPLSVDLVQPKRKPLVENVENQSLNDTASSFRFNVDATPHPTVTAESSQSMCEFTGPVRLSPLAVAPRLIVTVAPRPNVTVAPHLTVAVALTPLSSREKPGSAQHELGPNRSVGLSVTAHPPSSIVSPQAFVEHNLSPVGALSPSSGGFSGPRAPSDKISIVWASSNTWASLDDLGFEPPSMFKYFGASRVLRLHHYSPLRRIPLTSSSILHYQVSYTFMESVMKIVSTVTPSWSPSNLTSKAVPSTTLCVVLLRQPLRTSLQRNLSSASLNSVNYYLSKTVVRRSSEKLSLPFLQGKIKRLLDGCEIELQLIYKQFKASVDLFQQQAALSIYSVGGIGSDPSVAKDLGNRAMFLAHVTRFYRKKLAEFPAQMTDLLRTSCLRDALRAEEPCPKQTSFHLLLQPSSLITAAITVYHTIFTLTAMLSLTTTESSSE
ncbi:hypothetical protein Bca101_068465 [Brassica carinata]